MRGPSCDKTALAVGDRVKVERDERLYPSKGTWQRYRDKTGTVVSINKAVGEYGVAWTAKSDLGRQSPNAWFKLHELTRIDS
jgi:hypothetical protein